jgi:hypothetical protein
MNAKRLFALFVLIDFVALNIWAIATDGLGGFVDWMLTAHNTWHYVIVADLFIALGICLAFMWSRALEEGDKPLLETALTAFGSVGPLVWLVRRSEA